MSALTIAGCEATGGKQEGSAATAVARQLALDVQKLCDRLEGRVPGGRPDPRTYKRIADAGSIGVSDLRRLVDARCPGEYQAAEAAHKKREAARMEARKQALGPPPLRGSVPPTAAPAAPTGVNKEDLAARLERVANVLGYGPVTHREGFAYVMLSEVCRPVASGTKTWSEVIEEDVSNGAPGDAAARMASFLRTEFCPYY